MAGVRRLTPVTVVLIAVLAGFVSACGSGSSSSSSGSEALSSDNVFGDGCGAPKGAKAVSWHAKGQDLRALTLAPSPDSGPVSRTAVVVSNQSDETLCGWSKAVPLLRRFGTVWLYDYAVSDTGVGDVTTVVAKALASGAQHVLLVGASKGAKASLVAATTLSEDRLRGVIALSPEAALSDGTKVAEKVRGTSYPTLLVTSRTDPYQATSACRELAAERPSVTRLVVVPGSEHGTALLGGASSTTVRDAMTAFARQVESR